VIGISFILASLFNFFYHFLFSLFLSIFAGTGTCSFLKKKNFKGFLEQVFFSKEKVIKGNKKGETMEVEQQQQQQLAFYSKGRNGRLDSADDVPELEDIKPQLVDIDSSSKQQIQQQQQPRIRLASSVVSVATIIKTEPAEQQRLQRLSKAVALGYAN